MPVDNPVQDLPPEALRIALISRSILLIDVREPSEFAAERIQGALNFPLSTFDPAALPATGGKLVVFQCGTGKRSLMAVERSRAAGHAIDAHLAGGLGAWKAAGLPTVAINRGGGAPGSPA